MLCVCVVDVMDVVFYVCIVMRGGARCSKRHGLHAVELSQRSGKPCANCVDPTRPPS